MNEITLSPSPDSCSPVLVHEDHIKWVPCNSCALFSPPADISMATLCSVTVNFPGCLSFYAMWVNTRLFQPLVPLQLTWMALQLPHWQRTSWSVVSVRHQATYWCIQYVISGWFGITSLAMSALTTSEVYWFSLSAFRFIVYLHVSMDSATCHWVCVSAVMDTAEWTAVAKVDMLLNLDKPPIHRIF